MGDDGGLVVVPSEAAVQVLNAVGSKIYGMLDGSRSEEEIVEAVVQEYDIPEDIVRRDLRRFLQELKDEKMLATATVENPPEEATDE